MRAFTPSVFRKNLSQTTQVFSSVEAVVRRGEPSHLPVRQHKQRGGIPVPDDAEESPPPQRVDVSEQNVAGDDRGVQAQGEQRNVTLDGQDLRDDRRVEEVSDEHPLRST